MWSNRTAKVVNHIKEWKRSFGIPAQLAVPSNISGLLSRNKCLIRYKFLLLPCALISVIRTFWPNKHSFHKVYDSHFSLSSKAELFICEIGNYQCKSTINNFLSVYLRWGLHRLFSSQKDSIIVDRLDYVNWKAIFICFDVVVDGDCDDARYDVVRLAYGIWSRFPVT